MTLHPFDFKAALLAKHAQHVVLIHFPIALFIAGVAFDFIAHLTKQRFLAAAAYCNFVAAAVMAVPTVLTGILAWQWQLEGQRLKGILLMHLLLGCVSSLLIWSVCYVHVIAQRRLGGVLPGYRLPIEALGVVILTLTGHLGGFLSGVNGP
jgi:uncharacterized membrane protein